MNRHVKAPEAYDIWNQKWIFLAGTIDNGNGIDWQSNTADYIIKNTDYSVLNPRRDNWDSSWKQTIDNLEFAEQVNWELDAIEQSEKVLFYFAGNSLSPITLLELGICSKLRFHENMYVCCEPEFWRKGNIEVLCYRENIKLWNNLELMLKMVFKG